MARLLVGTDGPEASERVADYLAETLDPDDEVYVVNSHVGGDETDPEDIREGEKAMDIIEDALEGTVAVERHQFVRGNEPVEDLLEAADDWDADEYVVGIRKRSPVGKMMFGSTAQNLLLESDLPVRSIPLVSD